MEEEKDVISAPSAEQAEVTNEVETTQPEATVDQSQSQEISAPETLQEQINEDEVDEKGVSYKNRYMEMKRKHEATIDRIPEIIEQKLQQFQPKQQEQQVQEKEYTIEELEGFAQQNPNYRTWVEGEKAKLISKQTAREIEKNLTAREQKMQAEVARQQAESKLTADFPDLFVKDSLGRVNWDMSNPIVREIGMISQDPSLKGRPDGLYLAAELAYSRAFRRGEVGQKKKEQVLKSEVKKLQKKTLVEGGVSKPNVVVKDPVKDALNRAKQTGAKSDLNSAIGAYFNKAHLNRG